MSVPHSQALHIKEEVGFFQTIKSQILKRTTVEGVSTEYVDSALRQIVSDAIGSQDVVDIFDILGLEKPEITPLLSDEFLKKIKNMQEKNLAIELLRKLLNDEVKFRMRRNVTQTQLFSEMIANSILKYQNRTIEAAEVINELIDMVHHFRDASKRGEKLNLSEDEVAFYDTLDVEDPKVKLMGNETLRQIAIELVETIRQNATIDWTVKESVRAKLRVAVKRLLRKYGYPPEKQEKATHFVILQAQEFTRVTSQELAIRKPDKPTKNKTVLNKIKEGENFKTEFKSSFRYDLNLKHSNPKLLEKIIAKTVVAFMNAEGGNLFIGVDDEGKIVGLEQDYSTLRKQNSDGFELELRQSLDKYTKNKIVNELVQIKFHEIDNKIISELIISAAPKPIFVYDESAKIQECYVRVGNASKPYTYEEFYEYCQRRFT